MALPYQCIASYNQSSDGSHKWILFGAAGPRLVAQSSTGISSIWSNTDHKTQDSERKDEQEPPGKRIKLAPSSDQKSNFSILQLSNDQKHLVAVTAEDKCIRVFTFDQDCRLQQLSQRCMIRRPCSIVLSPDDSTILCADKFGDVYALPLLPSPEDEQNGIPSSEKVEQKKFVPSASLLTVHSGRNRKTLEEQIKQAEKGQAQAKETPKFKHDLLLGHVSMLTDIVFAKVESRSYVITADRDEHIRISRGPPQAHIIEGFCHGHEEFVSRLCLSNSGRLVSGGGDSHLYVWDWLSYRLVEKLPIRDAVVDYYKHHPQLSSQLPKDQTAFKIAVCGIWSVPSGVSEMDEILVACEAVPAIFSFKLGSAAETSRVFSLAGNALDVAFINPQSSCTAVVSLDHLHKPGSKTELREHEASPRLQCFLHESSGQWTEDSSLVGALDWFSRRAGVSDAGSGGGGSVAEKATRDILYGVENLRKRPGAED